MMENRDRPVCEFGDKCYRKNPKHFEIYFHPKESNISERNRLSSSPKLKTAAGNKRNSVASKTKKKNDSKVLNNKKQSCDKKAQVNSKVSRNLVVKKTKMSNNSNRKVETASSFKNRCSNDDDDDSDDDDDDCLGSDEGNCNDSEPVPKASWTYIRSKPKETKVSSDIVDTKNKTKNEIIKMLCLVDMPPDFYSFYEFCESVCENDTLKGFQLGDLRLVGAFDILSGDINDVVNRKLFLCHWRFYYDPPEFQTVLAAKSGFHIGYWRDNPQENPVFLASNNPNKDCVFKIEAENIFGTVYHYLDEFIKNCDPFKKLKISKIRKALSDWADKNKFSLNKNSDKMKARERKVLSKTFHRVGIIVPVDPKTKLGYRPLIETDANLKRICKLIAEASDESEKESLWENLQPLITAANIANDECDFGNSLELGIDLFCMGSPIFHNTIEHLLSTAYLLLDRAEFKEIIKAHLKFRRKGDDMNIRDCDINFSFENT